MPTWAALHSARPAKDAVLSGEHADEAVAVLGPAPINEQGDAGSYVGWRCWSAANGDGTRLYLGWGEVDEFVRIVGPDAHLPVPGECSSSPLVSRALTLPGGVRLGQTLASLEKRLQVATKPRLGWPGWRARYCSTPIVDDTGPGNLGSGVLVLVRHGKVVAIEMTLSATE